MANQAKVGADWGDDELDAIVADYFAMLQIERSGQPTPFFLTRERTIVLRGEAGRVPYLPRL
jgi:hypothetical protein